MSGSALTTMEIDAAVQHRRDATGGRRTVEPRAAAGELRIGISAHALGHGGGIERYVRDVVLGLSAQGIEPVAFARRVDPSQPESRLVEPWIINASFLPGKLRDHWFSWRLRRVRRQADVNVLIGCNRADSADIAICGGTHLGFLRAVGRRPRPSDHWQIALERRYYARAKFIVAHSNLMRDELKDLYAIPDAKIHVHHVPLDGERFAPVEDARRRQLRRKYGFGDGEVVLLFPSSSHKRKGLPLIERALEDTSLPVVVAVAGRAPERTSGRLRYLGFVEDIQECYQAADFTILASRYEPFGMVGVETVMCGTPAILSSQVGALEVIAPRAKFTFDNDDVDSLRAAITAAVDSLGGGRTVSGADLLYDWRVSSHVDSLLQLARRIVHANSEHGDQLAGAAALRLKPAG